MSVWFRSAPARVEQRTDVRLPAYLTQSGATSFAGVVVTPDTALQSVAVRSSVDLIASLGSELPVDVFTGRKASRRQVDTPEHFEDPSGDGQGLADWAYQVLVSWLLRGNLYGEVLERSPSGYLTQVSIHHPDSVAASMRGDGLVEWRVNGNLVTDLSTFLHRRVNPLPGVVTGLSPVAMHASMVGLSLSSTQFGLQWFRDGAHPSGILKNSQVDEFKKGVAEVVKERFLAAIHGTREPVIMGKGWDYQQLQIAPEESQFIATQGLSAAECCRMFGPGVAEILGYESGGAMTYANVESRLSHLLILSLNKWFTRLERLLDSMLPRGQYAKINRAALLQATTLERYKVHEIALRNQIKTPNEVRDDEDMLPREGGDEPNPIPGALSDDPSAATRKLAEMIQKIYLGVGVVLSADEAREILNQAGAGLTGPGPDTEGTA